MDQLLKTKNEIHIACTESQKKLANLLQSKKLAEQQLMDKTSNISTLIKNTKEIENQIYDTQYILFSFDFFFFLDTLTKIISIEFPKLKKKRKLKLQKMIPKCFQFQILI